MMKKVNYLIHLFSTSFFPVTFGHEVLTLQKRNRTCYWSYSIKLTVADFSCWKAFSAAIGAVNPSETASMNLTDCLNDFDANFGSSDRLSPSECH